jgi:hypothetical protein
MCGSLATSAEARALAFFAALLLRKIFKKLVLYHYHAY